MRRDAAAALRSAGVLAALALPARLAAQQFAFRYQPQPGSALRVQSESRTVMIPVGVPSVPDSARLETEMRIVATQRVLGRNGGYDLEIRIDSVRGRSKQPEGGWRDLPPGPVAGKRVRLTVNDRLHAAVAGAPAADLDLLRMALGLEVVPGFTFPEAPVAVGSSFPTGAKLPYHVQLSAEGQQGGPADQTLLGDLALTLDSVVARMGDSLAYLHYAGGFAPGASASRSEAETVTASLTGSFSGLLIWSRVWNAFVSGVSRVRVQAKIHSEKPSGAYDATLVWEDTHTRRVRP